MSGENNNRQQPVRKNSLGETIPEIKYSLGHIHVDFDYIDNSIGNDEVEFNYEVRFGFNQLNDPSFQKMSIEELNDMFEDHKKLQKENIFLKAKYPTRANELNKEDFDLDEFVGAC